MKTLKTLILALLFLGVASAANVRLDWTDNANNETGFLIERAPAAANPSFTQIAQVATNVVTYTDTTATNSTAYVYRIRAFNSAGNSAYSNQASVTTLPAPVTIPAAPTNLTATAIP